MPTNPSPDPDVDLGFHRDTIVEGLVDDPDVADDVLTHLVDRGALVEHPDGTYDLNGVLRPAWCVLRLRAIRYGRRVRALFSRS